MPHLRPFRAGAYSQGLPIRRSSDLILLSLRQGGQAWIIIIHGLKFKMSSSLYDSLAVTQEAARPPTSRRDKRLAGFRCDELAKVAPLYKKVSGKGRRNNAKQIDKARARESALLEKGRIIHHEFHICFSLFLFLFNYANKLCVTTSFLNDSYSSRYSSGSVDVNNFYAFSERLLYQRTF